jgi:hypothetical protein
LVWIGVAVDPWSETPIAAHGIARTVTAAIKESLRSAHAS